MDRDSLKNAIDAIGLDGVDRRSPEDMATRLSRAHRATPKVLLTQLSENEVKQVCELVGLVTKGRRKALIEQLLSPDAGRNAKRTSSRRSRRNTKERTSMAEPATNTQKAANHEAPVRLPDPPAGMMRVTKTELVWPGKYNDDGTLKDVPRVNLPFQVIETVNESRATREAKKSNQQMTLFDAYEGAEGDTFEEGWKNKLIWGDNLLVMGSLLDKFAGKIDLIYIDPPFATGADFSFTAQVGESNLDISKQASILEEKAYRDTWGRGLDSYLNMLRDRLDLIRQLLAPRGILYLHLGPNVSSQVRVLCSELLAGATATGDLIWRRTTTHTDSKWWGIVHDVILYFAYGSSVKHHKSYKPYSEQYIRSHYNQQDKSGRVYRTDNLTAAGLRAGSSGKQWRGHDPASKGVHWKYTIERLEELDREGRIYWPAKGGWPAFVRYLDEMPGVIVGNLWDDISPVNSQAKEDTGYDTQKPESLLERVISASSDKGDLVADFFCGAGTTLAVAEKLDRRWIGCDLGRFATHTTRKRLLGIEGCRPFEVLNLGKYERQYWQGVTFGDRPNKPVSEHALYAYLAFILKLYGAQPIAGMAHVHGKKGRALVHIGAVDAPVTIDEVTQALDECVKVGQKELHVLGWEWEMGLSGPNNEVRKGSPMHAISKQKGVKLVLLQIPREVMEQQAAAKGHVRFFELAYLDIEVKLRKELGVQVALKDFVIPNTELIPEDVRSKVKKWSDYIDYWAVDWAFQNDTFMQGWVAFRTRNERALPLVSDEHTYERPGEYCVLVKVIDIFGNDTSQAFDVEVK